MFGPEVERAAQAHARAEYPKESCGLVIAGRYQPQRNIAPDPENVFEIAASAFHPGLAAIVHSHPAPRHGRAPSAADMAFQIEQGKPFGIVPVDATHAAPVLWWGDFRLDDPLLGRAFVHGVHDCYALVRSWYWQTRRIKLPDMPRDPAWWAQGASDLYAGGLAQTGFTRIDAAAVRPGDCALFKSSVRGVPPHHCGVLIDPHRLLHHRADDVSKVTLVHPLMPYIHAWYRHDPEGVVKA